MAKGRTGFYLEGYKFVIYLGIPIMASWYYNDPVRQKKAADYWQFVTYPANPNIRVKEQIEEMAKKAAAEKEQRRAIQEQLESLNQQAVKSRVFEKEQQKSNDSSATKINDSGGGWRRWFGLGKKKNTSESEL